MTELLKELEAVVDVAEKATPGPFFVDAYGDVQANGEDVARIASSGDLANNDARVVAAAVNFLRTHHAEIAEAVKDAERWRALHWAEAPMVTVTGSQLARGIRPGDYAVPWDWPVTSRTRIRMIVMNNSAREVGE